MSIVLTPRISQLLVTGCVILAWLVIAAGLPVAAAAAEPANYQRPCQPEVKPAFLPLPPGAIEPAGWLRDWAVAAREGITGHLDEYHPTFANGWKGIGIKGYEPETAVDGTGGPLEQCAYWLDGALRLGLVLHDEALVKKIRARLDPVVEGVNKADIGTSFIYWKKNFKTVGFNSWANSQMGRALVALYQGTGDRRVLDALVKVYADYPVNMGGVDFHDVTGLCNLDAMLETYSLSGDRRILDRALAAIAQPAVTKDIRAWTAGHPFPGHLVIFYEDIRLPGLVYPWSGDRSQLQATLSAIDWLDKNDMLPYGVAAGEEYVSGTGALRKTETCDVTAMLLLNSWMYRILGDGQWGDRMERAFFNAGAAPIARDWKTMCYYQSPNRLRSDSLPCEQPHCPGTGAPAIQPTRLSRGPLLRRRRQPHHSQLHHSHVDGHRRQRAGRRTIRPLHSLGPGGPARAGENHHHHRLPLRRDDPHADRARTGGRVPPFPPHSRLVQGGKDHAQRQPVRETPDDKKFVRIDRRWSKGDRIELKFPMQPRLVRGWETEFPAANRKYFDFEPAAAVPAAAAALCERALRSAAVGPADPRRGSQHACERRQVAVCLGRCGGSGGGAA